MDPAPSNLPARNLGGRPSKAEHLLTPELIQAVGLLLAEGNFPETVADFLGIHRATWYDWIERGKREPNSIYARFSDTAAKSIAAAEILTLRSIRMGLEGWQSKAWLAERRFRQRWGRHAEITLRIEAEKLAKELGMSVNDVLEEAERVAAEVAGG